MMHILRELRWLALGLAIAALSLGAAIGFEYTRHGWPFNVPPPAAGEPGMAGMPGMDHAGHGAKTPGLPQGYAAITLDPGKAGALVLSTAPVEEREFTRTLRTVGVVALDETRTAHVHSKVRGWVDGIHVNFVGRKVAAGDALCSIYSQEVYAAEIEFASIVGRAQGPRDPLLAAARQRLALWDVPRAEIARLEATREPRRTFPLLAPRAGVVVAKEAVQGLFVDPSIELYTLSDLSRVWVLADIYEADLPYVHVGDRARLAIEGRPDPVEAAIVFLSPTIDEATRTLKVRFELDNRDGKLRPGAFVTVMLDLHVGSGLAVPESAVIRTGTRNIVFVVHGEQGEHIEPREVVLGPLVGDRYRVESGLSAGEKVATSAQFLLDSESRLRATSGPGGGHVH
jgi:membrane fusion protein, copper/silver efflux system